MNPKSTTKCARSSAMKLVSAMRLMSPDVLAMVADILGTEHDVWAVLEECLRHRKSRRALWRYLDRRCTTPPPMPVAASHPPPMMRCRAECRAVKRLDFGAC